MRHAQYLTRFAVHGALLAALLASVAAAATAPSYVTSWVGNTCGGAQDQWVQGHIQDMAVTPGGRVFATTWWDEDGKECGVYENGKLIGNLASGRHDAGRVIAANASGVYVAKGGFGKSRPDLRRFDPATFALSDKRRVPIGAGKQEVRGLAATESLVYAAIPGDNVVRVLDAKNMAEQSSFAVERPGKLAIAKDGTLWIVQLAERGDKGVKVLHYAADGTKLSNEIADVVDIQALAAAPDGRLLLGENGPDNQVLIYDVSGTPRRVGTFGQKGRQRWQRHRAARVHSRGWPALGTAGAGVRRYRGGRSRFGRRRRLQRLPPLPPRFRQTRRPGMEVGRDQFRPLPRQRLAPRHQAPLCAGDVPHRGATLPVHHRSVAALDGHLPFRGRAGHPMRAVHRTAREEQAMGRVPRRGPRCAQDRRQLRLDLDGCRWRWSGAGRGVRGHPQDLALGALRRQQGRLLGHEQGRDHAYPLRRPQSQGQPDLPRRGPALAAKARGTDRAQPRRLCPRGGRTLPARLHQGASPPRG